MRVVIFGAGKLGSALAEGLVAKGVATGTELTLITRNEGTRDVLGSRLNVDISASPQTSHLEGADLVVIAVKPQDAKGACEQIASLLKADIPVLSVMAGVPVTRLQSYLHGHQLIARAMPNLGAAVGASATALYYSSAITTDEKELIRQVLSSVGEIFTVPSEELVDAATAVAGSGPAYLCWFAEQLERAARELHFSEAEAQAMVLQTLSGTVQYLVDRGTAFKDLREQVTSPNGTTAAALRVLTEKQADVSFLDAIKRAFARARELAAGN